MLSFVIFKSIRLKKPEKNTGSSIIAFGRGKIVLYNHVDSRYEDDGYVLWKIIDKGCTVRRWGTAHGLGQISSNGPTERTTLDAIMHGLRIPVMAIHGEWECSDVSSTSFEDAVNAAELELLSSAGEE